MGVRSVIRVSDDESSQRDTAWAVTNVRLHRVDFGEGSVLPDIWAEGGVRNRNGFLSRERGILVNRVEVVLSHDGATDDRCREEPRYGSERIMRADVRFGTMTFRYFGLHGLREGC